MIHSVARVDTATARRLKGSEAGALVYIPSVLLHSDWSDFEGNVISVGVIRSHDCDIAHAQTACHALGPCFVGLRNLRR